MRILILSDTHISAADTVESEAWVGHFCSFAESLSADETWIFVLGDIIDRGAEDAYIAADRIFSFMSARLEALDVHFIFIPGNHDYCNKNLEAYTTFTRKYQEDSIPYLDFSSKHIWNVTTGEINFILADSVQNCDYRLPGSLDLAELERSKVPGKTNILFLHHGLFFEDTYNHTGVINQPEVFACIKRAGISFVFHSHSHATRWFPIGDDTCTIGVGSIKNGISGVHNEDEQFFEIQILGKQIESVCNWLWRGGVKQYQPNSIYPAQDKSFSLASPKNYLVPEGYVSRHILPLEIAYADESTRYSYWGKEETLIDVCCANPCVLLIAEAGMGKTFELGYLAAIAHNTSHRFLPVSIHLNIYNGGEIQEIIDLVAPEYKTVNPARLLVIFDGFDEVADPASFKRALSQYSLANPHTHICISMRSNFLPTNSTAFSNYKKYQLLELDSKAIQRELESHQIHAEAFDKECSEKGLRNLQKNPFYLQKLLEIYQSDGYLPVQAFLMQRLAELHLKKDAEKFEYAVSQPLEECQYEIEIALTRFACAMQLMGRSTITDIDYQFLLGEEDRKRIKFSSLTVHRPEGHTFSHNIFKEYFTAKWLNELSPDQIIKQISIPDTNILNPNWFNTVAFLLQMNPQESLIRWIFDSNPLILTRIEKDALTDDIRYNVLSIQVQRILQDNIWFNTDICSPEQLAAFSQSQQSLELLLSHICSPAHFRILYFCLDIISAFSDLYGREENVRLSLMECYQSDSTRPHEKRKAVQALCALSLFTPEITADVIERFADSSETHERIAVYEYLSAAGEADEHINIILNGIPHACHSLDSNDNIDFGESYVLTDCLLTLTLPSSIGKAIAWFGSKQAPTVGFYGRERIIKSLTKKAAIAYAEGNTYLCDILLQFFIYGSNHYERVYQKAAIDFFTETDTVEYALRKALAEAEHPLLLIGDMIDYRPDISDLFCKMYQEDSLPDPQIFYDYSKRLRNGDIFEKCRRMIREKTSNELPDPIPVIDYEGIERKDVQVFFDCLFDQASMRSLLEQLLEFYRDPNITFSQFKEQYEMYYTYPAGTYSLNYAIRDYDFGEEQVSQFFDMVDWDFFFMYNIYEIFRSDRFLPDIRPEQKTILTRKALLLVEQIDYHTAITETSPHSNSVSWKLLWYTQLISTLELNPPEKHYFGLLEIPYHFIPKVQSAEQKYEMVEKYLSTSVISQTLASLVSKENRIAVLTDMFVGCSRYRINAGCDSAFRFCQNQTITAYDRRKALEFLQVFQTKEQLWNQFAKDADDDFFRELLSILQPLRDFSFVQRVKDELVRRYQQNHSDVFLRNLIIMNASEGLEFYIQESEEKQSIPDYQTKGIGELTEAISKIDDVALVPLLLKAAKMLHSKGFRDGSIHTLYGSLNKAFCNCAKTDFSFVFQEVLKLKEELADNLDAVNFCSTLQQDMLSANNGSRIFPISLQSVKKLISQIE